MTGNDRGSIGFIGFGEAAFHIADGLRSEGVGSMFAYDIQKDDPVFGSLIKERANSLRVTLVDSPQELVSNSQYIFCATSAKAAEPIAKTIAPLMTEKRVYVDMNATSPATKQKIAKALEGTSALFVDAAVMESVPPYKHKVPMLVSGEGAVEFAEIARQWGMDVNVAGESAGEASAVKMFRSIFMKGLTMLLVETLTASHVYGVSDRVLDSLGKSLSRPLPELADLLLTRTVLHTKRRIAEMDEVIGMLGELGVEDSMSQGTKAKLEYLDSLNLKAFFQNRQPDRYTPVVETILALTDRHV